MIDSTSALLEDLSKKLNLELIEKQVFSGGCINQVFRLKTKSGSFVLKINSDPKKNFFHAEKEGLELLTNCSRDLEIRFPKVYSYGTDHLLLEFIQDGHDGIESEVNFGRELAKLHLQNIKTLELPFHSNYIGLTQQIHETFDPRSWGESFYKTRLSYFLKLLDHQVLQEEFDSLKEDLISFINKNSDEKRIGLCHGDLWSGNVFFDVHGMPILIDPAICIADGLVDIAMSKLFGQRDKEFYLSYYKTVGILNNDFDDLDEIFVLEKIYNLYHILNHALLFGGSYINQALVQLRQIEEKI